MDRHPADRYGAGMELTVADLALSRGDLVLVEGLSFAVARGGALVVTGANGSGKSTLLRALAGLHPPDAGTVVLTLDGEAAPVAQNAHHLGHANAMKADLTVAENLAFWTGALKGSGELIEEAAGSLALSGLMELPYGVLSAGQRRRVALARLWVAPRPLWLLDEPTAALDARSGAAVRDMVEAHRAEGGMVVAATHVDLGLDGAASLRLGIG